MKNTFGNSVAVTLFGESHGEYIGAVIDGLAPGIEIDRGYIEKISPCADPQEKYQRLGRKRTNLRSSAELWKT